MCMYACMYMHICIQLLLEFELQMFAFPSSLLVDLLATPCTYTHTTWLTQGTALIHTEFQSFRLHMCFLQTKGV